MQIPQMNVFHSCLLGGALGLKCEIPGSDGKIGQIKLGIETQEAIGDLRVEAGEEAGQAVDFLQVHVAGDQQGAGAEQRHFGALG